MFGMSQCFESQGRQMLLSVCFLRFLAKQLCFPAPAVAFVLAISTTLLAQTTVGTGSIVGTVTDPSDAVVSGAKVVFTNIQIGQVIKRATNSSGAYNSGALPPGSYKVQVSYPGFRSVEIHLTVQVGNTATANVKMQLGLGRELVLVQSTELRVNTEQATVQGVLTSAQIEMRLRGLSDQVISEMPRAEADRNDLGPG